MTDIKAVACGLPLNDFAQRSEVRAMTRGNSERLLLGSFTLGGSLLVGILLHAKLYDAFD